MNIQCKYYLLCSLFTNQRFLAPLPIPTSNWVPPTREIVAEFSMCLFCIFCGIGALGTRAVLVNIDEHA